MKSETKEIRRQALLDASKKYKTQAEFAKFLGMEPAQLNQLLLGNRGIGEELARKIAHKTNIPETTFMCLPRANKLLPNQYSIQEPQADYIDVPFVNVKLEAGGIGIAFDYNDDHIPPFQHPLSDLKSNNLNPDKLKMFKVSGESMEPRLYDGDIVMINTAITTPIDGEVFAVNYEGELLIKRLFRNAGTWYISSDNPDKTRFPNKTCETDYCNLIGLIVLKQSKRI